MRLYLTNLARATSVRDGRSSRFAREVGPGPVFGIMRSPPDWVDHKVVAGHIVGLMPRRKDLVAVKAGRMPRADYLNALRRRWATAAERGIYRPGSPGDEGCLRASVFETEAIASYHPDGALWDDQWWVARDPVPDGATLCCVCKHAEDCHRSVAAEVLHRAGWEVVLDGERFAPLPDDAALQAHLRPTAETPLTVAGIVEYARRGGLPVWPLIARLERAGIIKRGIVEQLREQGFDPEALPATPAG